MISGILESKLNELVFVDDRINNDFFVALETFEKLIKEKENLKELANESKHSISTANNDFKNQILKLRRIIIDLKKIVDYDVAVGVDKRLSEHKDALKKIKGKEKYKVIQEKLEKEIVLLENIPKIRKQIKDKISPNLDAIKKQLEKTIESISKFRSSYNTLVTGRQNAGNKAVLWQLGKESAESYGEMREDISTLLKYWEKCLEIELSSESKLYPSYAKIELTNTAKSLNSVKRARTTLSNNIKKIVNSRNITLSFLFVRTLGHYLYQYAYQVEKEGSFITSTTSDEGGTIVRPIRHTIYKGDLIHIPGTQWTLRDVADASMTASYIGSFLFLAVMVGYTLKIGKYAVKRLK